MKTAAIVFFAVVVAALLLQRFERDQTLIEDSRLTGNRAPYIQDLTTDSVIIRWLTEDSRIGGIRYGVAGEPMTAVVREDAPRRDHRITLRHLHPATRYYYAVDGIDNSDTPDAGRNWFDTAPVEYVDTRIWVIGDSGEAGDAVNDVKAAALNWMKHNPLVPPAPSAARAATPNKAPEINVWVALGDIAYESGTNEQYQAALFDTFGDLTGNTALWPVYGNHDARRETYFRIFDLPENGEAGGLQSHTENYYAMNYSNVHFVMLDSSVSDRSPSGEMANWLKADLAANTRPWIIAAFHHPPYSRGSHDSDDEDDSTGRMEEMRQYIVPILEQAGVDVVLSGHSHSYERSTLIDCAYEESDRFLPSNIVSAGINNQNRDYVKPLNQRAHQGTVYVVAGSSSKTGPGSFDHPAHVVGMQETGSVVIDVRGNKLVARFIDHEGKIKDRFSIRKDPEFISPYQGCQ